MCNPTGTSERIISRLKLSLDNTCSRLLLHFLIQAFTCLVGVVSTINICHGLSCLHIEQITQIVNTSTSLYDDLLPQLNKHPFSI